MRYITATIRAAFFFTACVLVGYLLTGFSAFRGLLVVTDRAQTVSIENPLGLLGIPIGLLAAVHSFRSALARKEEKTPVVRSSDRRPAVELS